MIWNGRRSEKIDLQEGGFYEKTFKEESEESIKENSKEAGEKDFQEALEKTLGKD